mgnify:CR=1 FL=1
MVSGTPPPPAARLARSGEATGIRRFAAGVAMLSGSRRVALTAVLGALTALAMPPWYVVPLLLPGFTMLVWLLDGAVATARPVRRSAATGFWFGFGFFVTGIHWLAEAFLVDPVRHGWMIPFAVGGRSALLALFPAAACAATVWVRRRFDISGAGRVIVLAVMWVAFEWVRSWIFTGFPWNFAGYVWSFSPVMMQPAAFAGVYGLSLLTIIAGGMPAVLADAPLSRHTLAALAIAALLPALAFCGGWLRLQAAPSYDPGRSDAAIVKGVRLRIVQAGIPQRLKWRADLRMNNLMRHVSLSRSEAATPPTHIIWPETAVPYYLPNDARAREIAATAVPPGGMLITGTVRYDGRPGGNRRFWNSAIAMSAAGDILATYDKTHLVPFGEYVPFGDLLPLNRIVAGAGDFSSGAGLRVLDLPGLPAVGLLICYEAIFPSAVVAPDRRPGWLLNLTNDGWFGVGAGPRQHLAISAMRATEEGLPLVRAAGTGISVVVDPYGRQLGRLEIGETGVLDSALPRPLPPTPYATYGNIIPVIISALLLLISVKSRNHNISGNF